MTFFVENAYRPNAWPSVLKEKKMKKFENEFFCVAIVGTVMLVSCLSVGFYLIAVGNLN